MKASRDAIVDNWWKTLPDIFAVPNGLLMFGKNCAISRENAAIELSYARLIGRAEIIAFATLMQKTAHISVAAVVV